MQPDAITHNEPRPVDGKFVNAETVADYFGVSSDLIYLMAREGRIPCHRIGRLVRFRIAEVEALIAVPAGVTNG